MHKIKQGFILPSAAYTVPRNKLTHVAHLERVPQVGDLIYGSIVYIGQHSSLENRQGRIHRIVFSSGDALGAIGGLRVLKERFDLEPDAISGVCSSSPLAVRELREYTRIPIFDSINRDLKQIAGILL